MLLRTRYFFNQATEAPEGQGASAVAVPVELNERQKARLNNLPGEVRSKIIDLKTEALKQAPQKAAAEKPAEESRPAETVKEKQTPEGVIDFAAEAAPNEDGAEELPEGDVAIEGLDAAAAKKLKDLNHKAQTFRKRTQAAEKAAKEAADKSAAAESQLTKLQSELETLRTTPLSGNWYADITDERQLAQIEQHAAAGLSKLKKVLKDGEEGAWTFLDGSKRELTVDDLDVFTTALVHVDSQREALVKIKGSQEKATSLIAKLKAVDGYEDLHRAALTVDWEHDRPTLAAKLALAELALSGRYVLMPRDGTKNSEKAPAAKSAGTSPAEMALPSASKPQRKEPPAEIAGTMPAATRGEDFDGLLSAAKARAAKGDKNAVADMLRIKRQRRLSQAA